MNFIRFYIIISIFFISKVVAQQDPHYTHYMYNTSSINPAYTATKEKIVVSFIGRNQWIGFKGAPETQNLNFISPLGSGMSMGMNITNEKIGYINDISIIGNLSYTIQINESDKLAFGLKFGGKSLNIDWKKGSFYDKKDPLYQTNFNSIRPQFGAGLFYFQPQKWYFGLSVPDILRYKSFLNNNTDILSWEKVHLYMIFGYVFTINDNLKFKPASLVKMAYGAPLSLDISANFYLYETFNAGIAWRYGDAISALVGVDIMNNFHIGYAYDLTSSDFRVTNIGTHEIILQYQFAFRSKRKCYPLF